MTQTNVGGTNTAVIALDYPPGYTSCTNQIAATTGVASSNSNFTTGPVSLAAGTVAFLVTQVLPDNTQTLSGGFTIETQNQCSSLGAGQWFSLADNNITSTASYTATASPSGSAQWLFIEVALQFVPPSTSLTPPHSFIANFKHKPRSPFIKEEEMVTI